MALEPGRRKVKNRVPLKALARVASVAAGVQFGWALQLSLLTPYVQELGIPHQWASLIWLCGPISGMFVQPVVGHYSDNCTSSYGRRRPFILAGAVLVVIATFTIGFAADLGYLFGDNLSKPIRPRAIVVFILGFWLLDLANNTLQGPCRALLADYTGKDQRRTRRANAFFSLFMAVGNILGFATGAYDKWEKWIWFSATTACDTPCANLKSAFMIGVILLVFTTILSVTAAEEIPWSPAYSNKNNSTEANATTPLLIADKPLDGQSNEEVSHANAVEKVEDPEDDDEDDEQVSEALFWELVVALRDLPRTMWLILLVTALTWLAWFPFLLFDTDWMGREVYRGEPAGAEVSKSSVLYYDGVHMGSFGLMMQSVILGLTSLMIEPLCRKLGPSRVWGMGNAIMAASFASMAVITTYARRASLAPLYTGPPTGVIVSALSVFAILGAPLAVTYSVPYSLTATYTEKSGGGQGLSMGVLNLAVVIPQVIVSVGAGPWDELLGGGNLPAFLLGSASALLGGICAVLLLPRPPPGFRAGGRLRRTRSSPIP
ncbi:solute carrier family 45, member 1/2/4 [Marchantia polymorpha subsp. ruderalis]|uniref:Sucrose transporter n=2 Tax=Marchantia polymorpha TaxID=3197 RepID=A0A176VNA3_MARPO|nr:hypothetical protein AXG93_2550s1190 [Marchantia polymorpha subsp. ruderalis]PTQ46995.1 hypothetical protein MARPO_0009s0099 [Marchantia polymorpha]BBN17390.1 hypothetical protein Mp_7g14140 [Marchantia polymorpha subsp. ruderalis]|eukprot:PTQ46995.1 hypothetical protein MARPO_0009s0099 [Marchantia polymorpha]